MTTFTPPDLSFHGDQELADGLVDLAVNVRPGTPPGWLRAAIRAATDDLAAYPDPAAATAAVARRHARPPSEVLVTAGGAEAFTLIARALPTCHPVVVHPQFTEPEAALRAAGRDVEEVILGPGFQLDPAAVPAGADLVVVGNPTNPTSLLHPAAALRALARPGRTLVVDEAFADCVPGEPESLAAARDVPGLIVVRSLTKTWGLAGLRAGYLLAAPGTVATLARARPPWAVSSPALAAVAACCTPAAIAEAAAWATDLAEERTHLIRQLSSLPAVTVLGAPAAPGTSAGAATPGTCAIPATSGASDAKAAAATPGTAVIQGPAASFILIKISPSGPPPPAGGLRLTVRDRLRREGFAVRRGDTFPGLGPDWLRVAVRDRATNDRFVAAVARVLATITEETR